MEEQSASFLAMRKKACKPGSKKIVVVLDFGGNIVVGREHEELDGSYFCRGWCSIVGVAVWVDGVKLNKPIHYDVLSPCLDHSSFAAHIALSKVLDDMWAEGTIVGGEELDVWSDNGGHFAAAVFAGACLAAIPKKYGFTRASWNGPAQQMKR